LLGGGWRRNRKYALLGSVRGVAQAVSYEVCLTLLLIPFLSYFYYHLNCSKMIPISIFSFPLIAMLYVSSLAETNRSPFDFSEGESELVSGFNTEYRSVPFVIIFLAEYISILFMSILLSLIYNISLYWDVFLFFFAWSALFILCRGTLPRLRYDQLIYLAWKRLLPVAICVVGVYIIL